MWNRAAIMPQNMPQGSSVLLEKSYIKSKTQAFTPEMLKLDPGGQQHNELLHSWDLVPRSDGCCKNSDTRSELTPHLAAASSLLLWNAQL